jgi:DNA-binding XRE family transcriptional regulator
VDKHDDKTLKQVYEMAKIGLTQAQIAKVMGRSRRSFQYDIEKDPALKNAYDEGAAAGVDEISQTAFAMAKSGKVPAMTMFWLKCRARWKEVTHVEHSGTLTLEQLVAEGYESHKKNKSEPVS